MSEFPVLDLTQGKPSGQLCVVPEELMNTRINPSLLYEVVRAYLAGQRQGTHSTKTRAEVRGGGHKPWKQKHTGRARAGSIRSPLWKKGGVIFGPKPKDWAVQIPKRKRVLALSQAFSIKLGKGVVFVKEENLTSVKKTKEIASLLKSINGGGPYLIVTLTSNHNLRLACRNLREVEVTNVASINAYEVLKAKTCVMTDRAWNSYLETRYSGV